MLKTGITLLLLCNLALFCTGCSPSPGIKNLVNKLEWKSIKVQDEIKENNISGKYIDSLLNYKKK